ncbi:MAG: DUF5686 and carboxypeptidase regulatory-like domain-containing protein [Melioribacteraceae bacterium]|nr:DUF5686 and carboxypeptidase regulatory-like domain-containing protein [Melioribacteraceae bacterium]MCF8353880.1 DUF5686 and carboxypeptidase regulatory-like domain-containing protein [Melioribacteraceae bacterium]MCF8393113.1 DUF5686 and carboxypeptidase regulatory-like domain-containing protein [Melioribacteraceae bacterium]MCF8419232.1 DUF5686 and carboxypeptidase regulatory-like domain-containing protein [Melioribacteraceae bacterium]
MKKILFAISLFFCVINITAQEHKLSGYIREAETNIPLSFANIRIEGTFTGTSANIEGKFELHLAEGNYNIIASFIGYKSDTVNITLSSNKIINFNLNPVSIKLPEVTVFPGENPALAIIRKAIETKHKREEIIDSYEFQAYTKGLIKTTKDISSKGNNVGVSLGTSDTAGLKITGILENESKGFFKKPGQYKEEIIARKQSSNFPSQINMLTGGRIIQDFYRNDIQFFGRPMMSPIADDAIDFYYYIIRDTLAMDNKSVYEISFEPIDTTDPGFVGFVYITGKDFNLIKIVTSLNDAANIGNIFSQIEIFQQYLPFSSNIYMPIDYRLFLEGNVFGIFKFGFELNSIMYDYEINKNLSDDFFDLVVLKVQPDADKKDSLYWKNRQTIPNTMNEIEAYNRIDSLEAIPVTFWDRFSFLSSTVSLTDNFSFTGPLGLYHFNRVEGNTINFGLYFNDYFDKRFDTDIDFSYGFADKKFKTDFYSRYLFGDYRNYRLSLKAYDKITDLFGESVYYNNLTSTLFNLISKYDFRDYYYSRGFETEFYGEVFPVLYLGVGFINRTDRTAFVNTDFSVFSRDKSYRINSPVFDSKINALTGKFRLDFRSIIEDGYFKRRTSQGNSYMIIEGEGLFSSSNLLDSDLSFEMYKLNLSGTLNSFRSTSLGFELESIFSEGPVPFQMMHALPGNIESSGKGYSFRTLRVGEFFGDNVISGKFEYRFNDEFFKLLQIPLIKDADMFLNVHYNTALLSLSAKSKTLLPVDFTEFKHPFHEIGFGVGHFLFPFVFEFTWKLNYRGYNDFVFGINTFAL